MDLEVKHISWVLLLMGSSAEQLALLRGGPGVIVSGPELLFLATARNKGERLET